MVQVAFMLDLLANELTRCTQPQSGPGLVCLLGLDEASVDRYWRPVTWPVASHVIRRPLRIWSAADGVDDTALDALARSAADQL